MLPFTTPPLALGVFTNEISLQESSRSKLGHPRSNLSSNIICCTFPCYLWVNNNYWPWLRSVLSFRFRYSLEKCWRPFLFPCSLNILQFWHGLLRYTDDICFSYSTTGKVVVWWDQQLQLQLDCIHCVLKLHLLDQANVLQLMLYFQAHVVSATKLMKLKNQTGIRTFSLYLEKWCKERWYLVNHTWTVKIVMMSVDPKGTSLLPVSITTLSRSAVVMSTSLSLHPQNRLICLQNSWGSIYVLSINWLMVILSYRCFIFTEHLHVFWGIFQLQIIQFQLKFLVCLEWEGYTIFWITNF